MCSLDISSEQQESDPVIYRFDHWELDIDEKQTALFSKTELLDHCTCDFCNNFYQTVRLQYPELEGFLHQFGLELFAPASLMPYPFSNAVECALEYMAFGKITQYGTEPVAVGNAQIAFHQENNVVYLSFQLVLPWKLTIPLEQARMANGEIPEMGFWDIVEHTS